MRQYPCDWSCLFVWQQVLAPWAETFWRALRGLHKQPHFATACAPPALNGMETGNGCEHAGVDGLRAWNALVDAAAATQSVSLAVVTCNVRQVIRGDDLIIGKVVATQLAS